VFTLFLPAASLLSSFTTQGSLLPFFVLKTFHVQYMFLEEMEIESSTPDFFVCCEEKV
jgi:hypothetical protein